MENRFITKKVCAGVLLVSVFFSISLRAAAGPIYVSSAPKDESSKVKTYKIVEGDEMYVRNDDVFYALFGPTKKSGMVALVGKILPRRPNEIRQGGKEVSCRLH